MTGLSEFCVACCRRKVFGFEGLMIYTPSRSMEVVGEKSHSFGANAIHVAIMLSGSVTYLDDEWLA